MDTKALRQKILDLAIRGKLVPQDPNDEPASVLLERIRVEKQQMVKDGKLKAKDIKNDTIIFRGEDNLHYEKFQDGTVKCIEEEIPFEVPEGWAWCRLKDLFNVCSSKRVLQSDWKTSGIPFYRAREIVKLADNDFVDNDLFISKEHYKKLINNYGVPQIGDLMVSSVGTIGKVYIVKKDDCFYYKDASVLCFENRTGIVVSEYAKYLLESEFLKQQMKNNSKGTTVDTITISAAMMYLCVLPPFNEQKRIVSAVNDAISYIIKVQNNQHELISLLNLAKSHILDLAIKGRLISQNLNDEPASVLLKRIRTEKEELIKQGKLKRDKKESIIFKGDDNSYYEKFTDGTEKCIDNELPFKLPDNWRFEKIRNIFIVNPKNNIDNELFVSFIPMTMINDQYSGTYEYDIKKWNDCKKGFTHFAINDVAFAKISPCFENRKSVLFTQLKNGYGAGTTELYVLRRYSDDILGKYLLYFLKSEYFISRGKGTFAGVVGQQRVDKEVILNTYIPIPPVLVQHKIIETVSYIMDKIDKIETSLS